MSTDLLDRIATKIDFDGPEPENAFEQVTGCCWLWTAAKCDKGYGRIGAGGHTGRPLLAHRAVYELLVGPIPDGWQIDHVCRVTSCVNPDHLEAVPGLVNNQRGTRATATHCSHGHEYTAENTYRRPGNPAKRYCRSCWSLGRAARKAAGR